MYLCSISSFQSERQWTKKSATYKPTPKIIDIYPENKKKTQIQTKLKPKTKLPCSHWHFNVCTVWIQAVMGQWPSSLWLICLWSERERDNLCEGTEMLWSIWAELTTEMLSRDSLFVFQRQTVGRGQRSTVLPGLCRLEEIKQLGWLSLSYTHTHTPFFSRVNTLWREFRWNFNRSGWSQQVCADSNTSSWVSFWQFPLALSSIIKLV